MSSNAMLRKLAYEPPEIGELTLETASASAVREIPPRPTTAIDGYAYADLARTYGTPLYLISERTLREKFRKTLRTFSEQYDKTVISYSYKTNFLSAVCAIFHEEGALAEVVSGFEYSIARDLGVPGHNIIFNGPYKTNAELLTAFTEGARVNLDSFSELERVLALAKTLNRTLEVGLRVNTYLNYPPWEKFGFNLESGQALEACKRIQESTVLQLRGLHLHAGTFITDPDIYIQGCERLIHLALKAEAEFDASIAYLDMGGGYASENTLHASFLRGEATVPVLADYAKALGVPMRRFSSYFKTKPTLFVEPGRIIVDDGMDLLAKVVATKKFEYGTKAVILDAGVNILPTAYWYKHDIQVLTDEIRPQEKVDVLGGLCMNIDVIRRDARLPALRENDLLVIKRVGAYNFTQSMQFIYLRPAVVLIGPKGPVVVRAAETPKEMRGLELLPEHLINDHTKQSKLVTGWT